MITDFIIKSITEDLTLNTNAVSNTVSLLKEGATIPFISRYRKEQTSGLTETEVRDVSDKLEYYEELLKRKETVLKTIEEQGKLTPALEKQINKCKDKIELEDIYLPYKPKKRTRATIAKEKGLQGLADILFDQKESVTDKKKLVAAYIDPGKGVNTYEKAIAGAKDIIAERISDTQTIRAWIREDVRLRGFIKAAVKKDWVDKPSKYQNYYNYREALSTIPSHRMLAIRRGDNEEVLSWKIEVDEENLIQRMEKELIVNKSFPFRQEIKEAIEDSYNRLIFPSIENEVFNNKLETDEKEAISVFAKNLKNLLLSSPAGSKVIMGIDPGIRTGCKVAIIDSKGDFIKFHTIYLNMSSEKKQDAEKIISELITKYKVELIAIGNGTASKETDTFVRQVLSGNQLKALPVMVSEAGASVYSASPVAVKEFPDLDVTARGAISIARRLQDPLAELVKIDPKSIGVGQYQHDVNQKDLKKSLEMTVQSCVNYVGVELNTASEELLSYVSGLGPGLAKNITRFRTEKGAFKSRCQLLKVPKLGPKAYEQCAGFLRIRGAENPLDNSAIHPEAYFVVEQIASDHNIPVDKIIGNTQIINKIDQKRYMTDSVGAFTLTDILNELKKPGLDPRKEFTSIEFSSHINSIDDLVPEMILDGIITNVTNFGAFVDIGVHQDGLIHISRLSNCFVKNSHDVVAVGDKVKVRVIELDAGLKRISLQRLTE